MSDRISNKRSPPTSTKSDRTPSSQNSDRPSPHPQKAIALHHPKKRSPFTSQKRSHSSTFPKIDQSL
ncbi:MAG: hypothetical protein IM550_11660 [Microcystis sp. M54BS1]|uniref:hypothetical protein n=1 Tax=unclassified Microcystis TaxID=2643300 RepID=UPI00257D14AE|nr:MULTISPECIES: hypothetical protein [unclassified Microcystis]MCA2511007.1 hypothetical protein [Microcystis sp. M60BS1]MCA2539856.1 hypothetical protein [Microcystis sp. M54BS1]MCA2606443.1 hypothetical protein [Microcystis sp. M26BS1]MCA2608916.1 hypothetical protein [Microcystis sp. M27BS1]MCA6573533.1 hypothetical protein [Pseudanabaena sp. M53BS1SP1A06MG]MCA6582215.1 hypothetical protein [Pseudanabaena sp. M34BS1SP1A06MG]MCA6592398.1 hypothetical protein [Pseudanabaena sp. M38BS1SP1A0